MTKDIKQTIKTIFTTGEIARSIGVAPRTVAKWVDSGILPGFRIPPNLDRRVRREDLLHFLRAEHMPLGDLGPQQVRTLLIGLAPELVQTVRDSLPLNFLAGHEVRLQVVDSFFEAGMVAAMYEPDLVIVDLILGVLASVQLARTLITGVWPVRVIALANEDSDPGELLAAGFHDVFVKPFDPRELVEKLRVA